MYVIFPADDVVSLTYGRVIVPRPSDASQLSRVLNQLQNATVADASSLENLSRQLNNHQLQQHLQRHRNKSSSSRSRSNTVSNPSTSRGAYVYGNGTSNDSESDRPSPARSSSSQGAEEYCAKYQHSRGRSPAEIRDDKPLKKELATATLTAALSIAAVQPRPDKSPNNRRQIPTIILPELAPDPRLQLTGLQSTTPGEVQLCYQKKHFLC